MTVEEVKAHPYFVRLTAKQQVFVETLCTNGKNIVAAAHKAWSCKSDDTARSFGNKTIRENPNVKWLVDSFFGIDATEEPFTRDEMMRFLARKARTVGDEKLVYQYTGYIMDLNGWRVKAADPIQTPHAAGSLMDDVLELEGNIRLPKPRD